MPAYCDLGGSASYFCMNIAKPSNVKAWLRIIWSSSSTQNAKGVGSLWLKEKAKGIKICNPVKQYISVVSDTFEACNNPYGME